MYEAYWKLKEKPFENTPDPRFLYYSQKHEEALARMLYAIREKKGGAILTGECGSGKTLLSRVLLDELTREQYQLALILNPKLPDLDLLREIVYQLGGDVSSPLSKTDLLHRFNKTLTANKNDNKNTVVVVDEAQSIQDESGFEELRLLLNFQSTDGFLFTMILLGQPELKEKINNLPQLKQRLSIRYHLKALSQDETKEYIKHRLSVSGREEEVFTHDVYDEIYRFSGGVPRRINNICDMALLLGYSGKVDKIDGEIIREVAIDLEEMPVDNCDNMGVRIND